MKTKDAVAVLMASIGVTACGAITGESPPAGVPPTPVMVDAQVTAVGEAQTPAPAVEPTTEPQPTYPAQPVFLNFPCQPETESQTWCLIGADGSRSDVQKPLATAEFYDHAGLTNRVLYGSHFPDHGAGPGSLAVMDLLVYDVGTGQTQTLVADEIVVEAEWAPNGQDLAYIRATPATYELVWRTADGAEKVLAVDVPHTLSFSPDAARVAFTRESRYELSGTPGIYVVDVASNQEVQVSGADRAGQGGIDDDIVWSFDEEHVIVPVGLDLVVAATDGSGSAALTFDDGLQNEPWTDGILTRFAWHPDGRRILANVDSMGPGAVDPGVSILMLELDDSKQRIVAATPVSDDGIFRGWHVPGESIWANTFDTLGPVVSVEISG